MTRHEQRFGITSFIYTSRRPFHPQKLEENILQKYFVEPDFMDEDEEENGEEDDKKMEEEMTEAEKKELAEMEKKLAAEKEVKLMELQARASEKAKQRRADMGELLRSKGFLWIASTNNVIGSWQQAGNVIRLETEDYWMCEQRERWEDNEEVAKNIRKDLCKPSGEEWEYGDRRQELVFIGQELKHEFIQAELDKCLLTEEEMKLGPEGWKETMEEVDRIKLGFDEEEEDGEEEEEGEGDEDDDEEAGEAEEDESPKKKAKKN